MLRPRSLGGPASYIIVSGLSMEPTLSSGDLVVLRTQKEYQVGDIVTFNVARGFVIHRIVKQSAEGFMLQGDNKEHPDPWRPTSDEIVGRMWFKISGAGRVVSFLRQPVALGAMAGVLGTLFVLSGGGNTKTRRLSTGSAGLLTWLSQLWGRNLRSTLPSAASLSSTGWPRTLHHATYEARTNSKVNLNRKTSTRSLFRSACIDGRMRLKA